MNECANCEHFPRQNFRREIQVRNDPCKVIGKEPPSWGACDGFEKRVRRCCWCKKTEAELAAVGLSLGHYYGSVACGLCADHIDAPDSHLEQQYEDRESGEGE